MVNIEEESFKKTLTSIILLVLAVVSYFLLKPILMAIVVALLLAFVFSPVYDWMSKRMPKDLAVILIIIFLLILIILPIWFLTPILIEQSFKIFQATTQLDIIGPLKTFFPDFFASEQFSAEIGSIISSFISRSANFLVNFFANIILNFPTIFLQSIVVFFTFYFVLRDKDKVVAYVESLSPFSKDVDKKIFDYSKGITASVLYGQVIIGVLQGIIAGIGFFLFGVPNALFLTILATIAGIFPVIGTALIWLPVVIYFLIAGNTFPALGVLFFGTIASTIDNFLRPMIVSKRTNIHSAVVIVGMIGGIFLFGILGIILGPLILAYLLVFLEIYRKKGSPPLITNPNQ